MEKYKYDPCVGCGFCCIESKCAAGMRLYASATVCPALLWDNQKNRYFCDLMKLPGNLGEIYRKELYAGAGCCSNLNSWRKDVKKRDVDIRKKNNLKSPISKEFQIFLNCLGKEFISKDSIQITVYRFIDELEKEGYEKDESERMGRLCIDYVLNNQTTFMKEFMG